MADRYYSSRQCSDYILILADLFINILLRYSIIAPESLFPLFELFDNLCSLVKYLNLSADDIFYPDSAGEKPIAPL